MNVFAHELKRHRKQLMIWSFGIGIFMALCMAKYDALASGGESMQTLLDQFPATMKAIFGMSVLDITTIAGYFGVCFLYIEVLLAVHAGLLGASVLSEEEQDKTTEFLYVKPISRARIVGQKILAGLLCIFIVWTVTVATAWASIVSLASIQGFEALFVLFMLAALLIQLVFFFFGTLAAAVSRHQMAARIVAAAVGWSYVIFVFLALSDRVELLRIGSVFCYFDAADVIAKQSLSEVFVAVCLVVACVGAAATFYFYGRRDLEV